MYDKEKVSKLAFRLIEEYKELKNILKKIEFCLYAQSGASLIRICPVCKHHQHRTHVNDCKLFEILKIMTSRAYWHDQSKLLEPERSVFDEYTPKLKNSTYGSQEYKTYLENMKTALDHHYKTNSHHPEHFENGMSGMTLMDIVEMFFDWMAAVKRHDNGDINRSIEINKDRFGFDDMLASIFINTAVYFNFIKLEATDTAINIK
jgi:hypothetical protein